MATRTKAATKNQTTNYQHGQKATQRPDVGVQDQFTTKKPPKRVAIKVIDERGNELMRVLEVRA